MDKNTKEFLSRIFINNHTDWWHDLKSETPKKKYGENARCLESTLEKELSDIPGYRQDDRRLFFFSSNSRSSIDGRYKSLGIEEKYNPLDIKEHLIDGAIHRGLIWVLGQPHNTGKPSESVSLYVVKKGSKPIDEIATDLFFPVLSAASKIGVYVIFISEETGEHWYVSSQQNQNDLPGWLSVKPKPQTWDLELEVVGDNNKRALAILDNEQTLGTLPTKQCFLADMGKKGEFTEYIVDDSCRVAVMDYGNQWRLIELGLLLRAHGYDAVKVLYNREKHKNTQDRTKQLQFAGKGVERRVADKMLNKYAIKIDWQV
jgi:hypothetical protein